MNASMKIMRPARFALLCSQSLVHVQMLGFVQGPQWPSLTSLRCIVVLCMDISY